MKGHLSLIKGEINTKSHLRYEAIAILKTFDQKELSVFEQFLTFGPYLNTIGGQFSYGNSSERKRHSKKLLRFFKILKSFYPDFSRLTNKYLSKQLGIQSTSTIKKYFVQLKLLCDHFLVLKEISTDKYYYNESLMYQYQGRELNKLFDQKYARVLQELDESESYCIKDFLMRFNSGLINYGRHAQNFQMKTNKDIFKAIDLQVEPSFNLLFYFVLDSINLVVNLIGHANATNIDLNEIKFYVLFKKCFPDDILKDIVKGAIQLTPGTTTKKIIELYWLAYLFRTTKGKKAAIYFKKYIDILASISPKLNLNDKYDFYHERFFGFWLAMEFPEFEDLEFRLYDLYLEHKAYRAAGKDKLQLQELKNLIIRGDYTGRYTWTTKILKNYVLELRPDDRKTIQHLRNAFLFFLRDKNFEQSLEELREIERTGQHSMTRDTLHLYILIYFELGYYDSALTAIDSLRKYLSNQNVAPRTAGPFKLFITCVRKLITNKINNKDDYEDILTIINESNVIASKKWLLEKINQQKTKRKSSKTT